MQWLWQKIPVEYRSRMKNILALDTSSPLLSVALKKGEDEILETRLFGFLKHSDHLMPAIGKLLKKKGLSIEGIDTFLINRGPGSFTGLRVGFATLKGFLSLQKKTCYGALSLDMIAASVKLREGSWLAVCLDAHREKVYARFYQREKSGWRPKGIARVLSFPQFVDLFPSEISLAGDAIRRYKAEFEKTLSLRNAGMKIHFLTEKYWHPTASALIRCLLDQKLGNEKKFLLKKLETRSDLLPLYLRPSVAEEKRKAYANAG